MLFANDFFVGEGSTKIEVLSYIGIVNMPLLLEKHAWLTCHLSIALFIGPVIQFPQLIVIVNPVAIYKERKFCVSGENLVLFNINFVNLRIKRSLGLHLDECSADMA